jgi:hypothetical protein
MGFETPFPQTLSHFIDRHPYLKVGPKDLLDGLHIGCPFELGFIHFNGKHHGILQKDIDSL